MPVCNVDDALYTNLQMNLLIVMMYPFISWFKDQRCYKLAVLYQ